MSKIKILEIGPPNSPRRCCAGQGSASLKQAVSILCAGHSFARGLPDSLPFSLNDCTAGSENELQAAVSGDRRDVDLPLVIEQSSFFANIIKRINAGETSRGTVTAVESYLKENDRQVWENSWVRFPLQFLNAGSQALLESDLLADKRDADSGPRSDADRFIFIERGEKWLRIPVSYLLKLSMADVLGAQADAPGIIPSTGLRLLNHFSNDNTSPETFSFHVVRLRADSGMGLALARETSRRFLLTQLLTMYANQRFKLLSTGQRAIIYFAPTPPVRQRQLNDCISDAFYRELFMSPCLSGWDRGEEKHRYMCLCHQVLSRSQLNALGKLREAGIITRNLVTLPNMSNISLANNGTHISLGSLKLSRMLKDAGSGFTRSHEKVLGDLVIKIAEHFLPLFVGTYTGAPYRMDFTDLHPEKALGFLPHELDYTHLRMMWRRWKKKADIKLFGHPITPFGPVCVDRILSGALRLKGDFLPDFRLIDYFVALLSTDRTPALDGRLGNGDRLKQDLADMGVFDDRMALYLLYRLREFDKMGFTGFEGRFYSLFENLGKDMAQATNLQTLITALAFKYIVRDGVTHEIIPDTPSAESERRQIFFGTAIGIPTFFVRSDTSNQFLKRVVARCARVRESRRYPGYLRVYNLEYRKALAHMLREDGSDLIEMLNLDETIVDLLARLEAPRENSTSGRLTQSILEELNARSPLDVPAKEFNLATEDHYRNTLRREHIEEALEFLEEDLGVLESRRCARRSGYERELEFCLHERNAVGFLFNVKDRILEETASLEDLTTLINLILIAADNDIQETNRTPEEGSGRQDYETSIHRAAHW